MKYSLQNIILEIHNKEDKGAFLNKHLINEVRNDTAPTRLAVFGPKTDDRRGH